MIALLQRVSQARVDINGNTVGRIGRGLLVLLCVEKNDTQRDADKLLDKLLKLRIFADENGKMNLSVMDKSAQQSMGEMLVVSQFTLAADVSSGNRPGFSNAAPPELGKALYEYFANKARLSLAHVATGEFGADMQVHLVNDGPVTISIKVVDGAIV